MEFPRRTAGECALPDGRVVWVQTLNQVHKDAVLRNSHRAAYVETASIQPGGKARDVIIAQFKAMDTSTQAEFLANHEFRSYEIGRKVDERFPPVIEPERGELTEAEYMKAMRAFDKAKKKNDKDREEYEEMLYKTAQARATGLSAKTRLEECIHAKVAMEFAEAFARQYVFEQIYRATRSTENHSELLFGSVEEVMDLDDDVLHCLLKCYNDLDTVRAQEIPTSPALS